MALEATGKIYLINAAETRSSFTFRKFVLETGDNPRYPQFVEFQTTRDGITKLDSFKEGDEVRVEFNLRGREWKSPSGEVKYFNTLDAWKIDAVGAPKAASSPKPSAPPPPSAAVDPNEDIPF